MKGLWNDSTRAWIGLAARLYLGGVFVFACLHKIAHPGGFATDIATYGVLPSALVNLLAIALPWIELGTGALLILGFRARAAAFCVAGMMAMFTAALILALARGLDISCGCFAAQGIQDDPISILTVFRDLGWLALSLYVVFLDRVPLGVDAWLARKGKAHA